MTAWTTPLPPAGDRDAAVAWVARHLAGLVAEPVAASPAFVGGQSVADARLAAFDVRGYAGARNEVWPPARRGASRLSPYVRHGLLPLPRLWQAVADGPARDRDRYRDELLWQEYARHLYARLGGALARPVRREPWQPLADIHDDVADPWSDDDLACVALARTELETDGWLPNQARMWLASHWGVRHGADWRDGEDAFYRHLLDGSRAANRLGWQWTIGAGTGRVYGFSRSQVIRRAPGLCDTCVLSDACPIEDWPSSRELAAADEHPWLRSDPDPFTTGGPLTAQRTGTPEAVWLTAESLGDADPALAENPGLPARFVFDAPLLAALRLSGKRLVFLVETLADLATRRDVQVAVGAPTEVLAGGALATTFAPVPGWRRRRARLDIAEVHPWPWLARPHGRSAASFSAWRRAVRVAATDGL